MTLRALPAPGIAWRPYRQVSRLGRCSSSEARLRAARTAVIVRLTLAGAILPTRLSRQALRSSLVREGRHGLAQKLVGKVEAGPGSAPSVPTAARPARP